MHSNVPPAVGPVPADTDSVECDLDWDTWGLDSMMFESEKLHHDTSLGRSQGFDSS